MKQLQRYRIKESQSLPKSFGSITSFRKSFQEMSSEVKNGFIGSKVRYLLKIKHGLFQSGESLQKSLF